MTATQPMTTVMGAHGVHIFKCSRTEYLEAAYIGEIRRYLSQLMKTEPPVRAVLDLTQARLLSSEAIGLIVALSNVLRAVGGGLHLANISEETASVLAIANLQDVLAMYASVDDAIAGYG
jgi:anti-anti-sigma factor